LYDNGDKYSICDIHGNYRDPENEQQTLDSKSTPPELKSDLSEFEEKINLSAGDVWSLGRVLLDLVITKEEDESL